MRKTAAAVAVAVLALAAATAARGDVVIRLKNGVEVRVPVAREDVASISFEDGGRPAAAPAQTPPAQTPPAQTPPAQTPSSQTPVKVTTPSAGYDQPPLPPGQAGPSGPQLPGASQFLPGAFGRAGAEAGGSGRVIRIGRGKQYERLGDVAGSLQNGDTVEIEAGLYINDFAELSASNLTLKGVGGRPHFRASVSPPNGKAIWVISGDDVTVDNIEFSGADVGDDNGAGIRAEGGKLTVRNAYFHHNEFGLLSANNPEQELTIANSEVGYNIRKDNYAHGIYVGDIKRFTLINSYVHHNHRGHQVKSRARETYILYNRLSDEDGVGSYLIDDSNCGTLVVLGNVLHKGANAENHTAISFGAEGCKGAGHRLYVGNNTYVNGSGSGSMVKNHSGDVGVMANNLVIGAGLYQGDMTDRNNVKGSLSDLVNPAAFDYRLKPGSSAIDKAAEPGRLGSFSLTPVQEYVHPMKARKRPAAGRLDVGAYEFVPR
jgi:hypothetical protein